MAPLLFRVAIKSQIDCIMGVLPVSPSFSVTLPRGGTLVNVIGFMGVLKVMGSLISVCGWAEPRV